jgi:hypothetical protein
MRITLHLDPSIIIASFAFLVFGCDTNPNKSQDPNTRNTFDAFYGTPVLDGSASDEAWDGATWYPIDQPWYPTMPDSNDYKGRYKVLWDENMLYVLAEITDDSLIDIHPDGLVDYFHDDCLEVFLDEDGSGGDHGFNHSAFAYHVALDGHVVDIAPDSTKRFYDDHCISKRTTKGNVSMWELGIKIFDGKIYQEGGENIPKMLAKDKRMGFAIAYCDNDRSPEREHFMGNVPIAGDDKNKAWCDASVFGILSLK